MMICEPFAVVNVPFPFSDLPRSKRRKALVLSTREFNHRSGATVLMMITSATHSQWYLDVPLASWQAAGLLKPCVARAKLFTLDNRFIIDRVGSLAPGDAAAIARSLQDVLPLGFSGSNPGP